MDKFPSKAEFDRKRSRLEEVTRRWHERESLSFDEAVQASDSSSDESIWQEMPAIDSKSVVSLLVELEPELGDCKLPATVINPGGYSSIDDLVQKLLPRIRERCSPATGKKRAAKAVAAIREPPPPQV